MSTARRARSLRCHILMSCHTHLMAQDVLESHFIPSSCMSVSLDLNFLPFYFDLSFSVFFHFSVLMHPEPHTDLDNLNTMQHNLRTSAKGSNDAYEVSVSLTFIVIMLKLDFASSCRKKNHSQYH